MAALFLNIDESKLSRPPGQDGHHQTRAVVGCFAFTKQSLTRPGRGVKKTAAAEEGSVLVGARRIWLLMAAAAGTGAAAPVDLPNASPSPELGPAEVVQIQLQALRQNDETDAGIAVAFRFASPANKASTGPLERFVQMIKAGPYRLMLEFETASYKPIVVEGIHALQRVTLVGRREIRTYDFFLRRQTGPPCKGCWMTEAVVVVPGVEEAV